MRGLLEVTLRQRHNVGVEFFKRALDVLRSLRESWILVPKDDRGAVFEKTFLFGIQNLYLDALMQVRATYITFAPVYLPQQTYATNPSPDLLEELETECDLLICEVDEALRQPRSQEPVDPGFVSSFYLYPRGMAYAYACSLVRLAV
jgi:hypothetical protein